MHEEIRKTPLILAVEKNSLQDVRKIIENGADVNEKLKNGDTAIIYVTRKTFKEYTPVILEILKTLIDAGADINVVDSHGWTPLWRMSIKRYSNKNIAKLLIDSGADVNAISNKGNISIIENALINKLDEIILLLIEAGVKLNRKAEILYMFYKDDLKRLKSLANEGGKIEAICIDNLTPLMLSIKYNSVKILQYLLTIGVSLEEIGKGIDNYDMTPLEYASYEKSYEIEKLLLKNKVNVNIEDRTESFTIKYAIQRNNIKFMELLIEKGAKQVFNKGIDLNKLLLELRKFSMASTIKRTNPGDAANIFVRCMLSDISDLLGGFSKEDLEKTVEYFDYKCPYTGEDISVEYRTGKWVLDHLIPHNRESVGLNLYGNIIVTTRSVNSAKAAKSFEDFIRYETKGSEEEKEARIEKIRCFQNESGYFDKIKNIDEIKELCKKEYDFIQNRLKAHVADYELIFGKKKEIIENRQKRASVLKKETSNLSDMKRNNVKISKNQAIQILRKEGLNVYGQITFSSENSSVDKYWANPSLEYIYNDWWLILNDVDNRILYVFFIPANSIQENDIVVRADKPELIDIQINYADDFFMDSRSKIYFGTWLKKSIAY